MDESRLNKFQHQFWVTKETLHRKLGKKEDDDSLVASDASLDAKLELFKSIQQTSAIMIKILDRYQEKICFLAQEENTMGRFLKEYGKADKTNAGKMMIQLGKSLVWTSQQEIGLRPPLLRLYQEVDTFRNRAVEDTYDTIKKMEKYRTEYRASLKWMKNVSQELDPDTYKQMEKFRKVQTHVRRSKAQFDKLKLACLQKVDLLAAARCNMFSHALIHYQSSTMQTSQKVAEIFRTLASTFKGYQHFEFCVIKELVEPQRKAIEGTITTKPQTDSMDTDLLVDLEKNPTEKDVSEKKDDEDEALLDIGGGDTCQQKTSQANSDTNSKKMTAADLISNEKLLENLLGGPLDQSPDTELASEALDMGLPWPTQTQEKSTTEPIKAVKKEKSEGDMLADEFENIPFEIDNSDTASLLNELLSSSTTPLTPQQALKPKGSDVAKSVDQQAKFNMASTGQGPNGFLPSQLLDLGNEPSTNTDLLNFYANEMAPTEQNQNATKNMNPQTASWFDIFADLDPISNPDAIGQKKENVEEQRYC